MDITALFDALAVAEDIEIIKAALPEGTRRQPARDGNLQRLQGYRERGFLRFAYQQVNVLGHDDVGIDLKVVLPPHRFQRQLEDLPCAGFGEIRHAAIAGERYKVMVAVTVAAFESASHAAKGSIPRPISQKMRCGAPHTH